MRPTKSWTGEPRQLYVSTMLDDAARDWPMVVEETESLAVEGVDEPIGYWLAELPPEVPSTAIPCLGFVT